MSMKIKIRALIDSVCIGVTAIKEFIHQKIGGSVMVAIDNSLEIDKEASVVGAIKIINICSNLS